MFDSLINQVAVITGAGRGIGRAIAQGYAQQGASVVCAARSQVETEETVAEIKAFGGKAAAVVCDVTDMQSVENLFATAHTIYGGIDLVVLNAGIDGDHHPVVNSDPALWTHIIDVNLMGAYRCARTAIPYMQQRGGGQILTLGSGLGHHGRPEQSAYACSKAGLWMFTRILANELATENISVNEIIPGPVNTSMASPQNENSVFSIKTEWIKEPKDVVPLALFLATHPKPGPTGQSFSLMRRTS